MRIVIDSQVYRIHLDRIAHTLQILYNRNKDKVDHEQLLPGGVKIDFSRKSLLRTGFKSLLVPLILPIINAMYESKGIQIRPRVKHEDLIDYIVECVLTFIAIAEGDIQYYVTTAKDNQSFERYITSVSPARPDAIGQPDGRSDDINEQEAVEANEYSGG